MAIVEDIPDEPSTLRNRIPLKSPHAARQSTTKPLLDINEILQPDVIQEALDIAGRDGQEDVDYEDDEECDEAGMPIARAGASEEVDERDDNEKWWDEVFDSLITTVPFVFLYLLLNILVHLQYQHRPTIDELVSDMLKAIPTLGVLVFYTNRHSDSRVTISFLMAASILSGTRMIWLVNNAGWSMTTQQAPPIGTLWILTVVQLPLTRAVFCLGAVAGWTWYTGSAIMPK